MPTAGLLRFPPGTHQHLRALRGLRLGGAGGGEATDQLGRYDHVTWRAMG